MATAPTPTPKPQPTKAATPPAVSKAAPAKPAAPKPAATVKPAPRPAAKLTRHGGLGVRWPFLVAGAGVVGLAIWKFADLRKGADVIIQTTSDTMNSAISAAKSAAFNAIIPASAQQYADIIKAEAARVNVSPFILVALGSRETRWGDANRPPGPGGTGDFTARHYSKQPARTKLVSVLPSGWRGSGSGPWYIPDDEQGWGRGLMQIDWAAHQDWLQTHDWRDPRQNIGYAADVLSQAIAYFQRASTAAGDPRPLSGNDLLHAALAAYNRGPGGVLKDMMAGLSPDANTTGGDYGGAVLNAALSLQAMLG